jgi:MFS family permease
MKAGPQDLLKTLTNRKAVLAIHMMLAAFITYCSMYAFRKPFTAGTYDNLILWGIDYKIVLITTQVVGYMLSKFIGIRVISSMNPGTRIRYILVLIGLAWFSLFLFGLLPYPYNFVLMFFNGLPLGMIWGIVFSFLEGRRNTELLGAGMSASFIVASGFVKAIGRYLIEYGGISEFWMPFMTGLVFIPFLALGVWMLSKIPKPEISDEMQRARRLPMNNQTRWAFFREFKNGIIMVVMIYIALTVFRDVRDNFAVELWTLLGYEHTPQILMTAEIPIAIGVFIIIALMIFIRENDKAFFTNIFIIMLGGIILIITTLLFQRGILNPTVWMIMVGFGMYLSYVSYHTMLFERWIALFKYPSNIGFLMYIADSFGYLGSVSVLFYKNFASHEFNWLSFTVFLSYLIGGLTVILSLFAYQYFKEKARRIVAIAIVNK